MAAKFSYEESLSELEKILSDIENGEIGIDDLFEQVKKAGHLIGKLKKKLYDAENKVLDILKDEEETN